jgi:hypothetical protein
MIRKTTIALTVLAAALVLPAAAAGKGASKASLQGPYVKGTLVIPGDGESGGTPLGDVASHSGYFSGVFGQDPNHPMLASAPKGDLGPAYHVTYVVPGPNGSHGLIRQVIYPYAAGGAVSFMRPGQFVWEGQTTVGGWYRGGSALKQDLVALGLPVKAPDGGGFSLPVGAIAGIAAGALAAVLLILAAFRLRRRPQPVPA